MMDFDERLAALDAHAGLCEQDHANGVIDRLASLAPSGAEEIAGQADCFGLHARHEASARRQALLTAPSPTVTKNSLR